MTHASQKILVTGGAGFIGSHTVDLLLEEGHRITVLDNLSSGKLINLDLNHPRLVFVEGDVLHYPLVEQLVAECDAVLHLAAISSVPASIKDPINTFKVNTLGFLHVILAVKAAQRRPRLVYASSAAVYGNQPSLPCLCDAPLSCEALSPYALQKIHNEHYASLFAKLDRLDSLGLRYFNVYGPRQDPHSPYSGVISLFMNAYQHDKKLMIFGDGLQSRDFIYVKDVAVANVKALQSDCKGVVNIATGVPETLLNIVEYLQSIGGKSAIVSFEAARIGDIQTSFGNTMRARDFLGFSYQTSLREGLKMSLETDTSSG